MLYQVLFFVLILVQGNENVVQQRKSQGNRSGLTRIISRLFMP